jgi:hypothetical protein
MSNPRALADRSRGTTLAVGVVVGTLLGIATSLMFWLILIGPLVGLALALSDRRGGSVGTARAGTGGGLLIGAGGVYLLGAINTLYSCQGQDVCGGASVLPFAGYAVAVLATGLVVAGIALTRSD